MNTWRALVLTLLWGCGSSVTPPGDAGTTTADARPEADATVGADAEPAPDATPSADAAPAADATPNPDAAPGADAAPDAGAGEQVCDEVADVDAILTGSMVMARTFLPTSTTPRVLAPIVEAGAHVSVGATRVRGRTLEWHAQISSLTGLGGLAIQHFLVDPVDGAVYAAMENQLSDTTAMRFYNADGSLFREYTPGGAPGADLVGRSRQSNFFLVKYDARGAIQWISRFGPNSNGDRSGNLSAIGFVGQNVRVLAAVEDASRIVFAAGTPSEFTNTAPSSSVFWGEFAKSDGSFVANSARFVTGANRTSRPTHSAQGQFAHSAAGETAIQVQLRKESQPQMETFTLGALGARPLTVTATRSTVAFAKIGADGEPTLMGTLTIPSLFGAGGDPRAVALGATGHLVAGGQFPGSAAPAFFRGVSGQVRIETRSRQSYLVAFAPDGALAWVQQIPGDRNAISRILVRDGAVYVLGTHAAGEVIGTVTVPADGYAVTRHSLATGEAEWVRVFAQTAAMPTIVNTFDLWFDDGELVIPSLFGRLRLVGGDVDRVLRSASGDNVLGAIYLSPAGALLRCEAVATSAAGFQHF